MHGVHGLIPRGIERDSHGSVVSTIPRQDLNSRDLNRHSKPKKVKLRYQKDLVRYVEIS
ncbi:17586_t:CDS:1, partial [Acaulospora morrowiae]